MKLPGVVLTCLLVFISITVRAAPHRRHDPADRVRAHAAVLTLWRQQNQAQVDSTCPEVFPAAAQEIEERLLTRLIGARIPRAETARFQRPFLFELKDEGGDLYEEVAAHIDALSKPKLDFQFSKLQFHTLTITARGQEAILTQIKQMRHSYHEDCALALQGYQELAKKARWKTLITGAVALTAILCLHLPDWGPPPIQALRLLLADFGLLFAGMRASQILVGDPIYRKYSKRWQLGSPTWFKDILVHTEVLVNNPSHELATYGESSFAVLGSAFDFLRRFGSENARTRAEFIRSQAALGPGKRFHEWISRGYLPYKRSQYRAFVKQTRIRNFIVPGRMATAFFWDDGEPFLIHWLFFCTFPADNANSGPS